MPSANAVLFTKIKKFTGYYITQDYVMKVKSHKVVAPQATCKVGAFP